MDGIASAQEKGIRFGRKPALSEKQQNAIRRLRNNEAFTIAQLMEQMHSEEAEDTAFDEAEFEDEEDGPAMIPTPH